MENKINEIASLIIAVHKNEPQDPDWGIEGDLWDNLKNAYEGTLEIPYLENPENVDQAPWNTAPQGITTDQVLNAIRALPFENENQENAKNEWIEIYN